MGRGPSPPPPPPPPHSPPPPPPHPELPAMNALEILRETARILRADPSPFMSILGLLLCPVSAALLLSGALPGPAASAARALARRLALLAVAGGLPPAPLLRQVSLHLAGSLVSAAACFPLLLTLLLLARAAVAYSVACSYASRRAAPAHFLSSVVPRVRRRLLRTYLCACASASACLALFLALLLLVCNLFAVMLYPPEIVVYPALLTVLAFSVAYAHTIIVCNLAIVISVLEEASGLQALLRSVRLIKGQTQAGLLIFLGSTIGLAFVEGLFEHRVKTLSYGDGSSRLWEGPLLVLMYSFVVLVDSMMSAVFYFTCRSSSGIELSGENDTAAEEEASLIELEGNK